MLAISRNIPEKSRRWGIQSKPENIELFETDIESLVRSINNQQGKSITKKTEALTKRLEPKNNNKNFRKQFLEATQPFTKYLKSPSNEFDDLRQLQKVKELGLSGREKTWNWKFKSKIEKSSPSFAFSKISLDL